VHEALYRLRRLVEAPEDYIEAEITREEKELAFEHQVFVVAIYSDVDCYVKFDSHTNKAIKHLADSAYIWFRPCSKLYVRTVEAERGKFYAWGEVI